MAKKLGKSQTVHSCIPQFPGLRFEVHPLREEVCAFLANESAPGGFVRRADTCVSVAVPEFSRKLGARGWLGTTWPKEHGRYERSFVHRHIVTREILGSSRINCVTLDRGLLDGTSYPALYCTWRELYSNLD
jgi:alkylation response protein AidB-like acyl-CoA dehydrogenase